MPGNQTWLPLMYLLHQCSWFPGYAPMWISERRGEGRRCSLTTFDLFSFWEDTVYCPLLKFLNWFLASWKRLTVSLKTNICRRGYTKEEKVVLGSYSALEVVRFLLLSSMVFLIFSTISFLNFPPDFYILHFFYYQPCLQDIHKDWDSLWSFLLYLCDTLCSIHYGVSTEVLNTFWSWNTYLKNLFSINAFWKPLK